MNIGQAIKRVRKEKDITQKELSIKTGMSQNAISLIEKEDTSPNHSTIVKICKALDIPESLLYLYSINRGDVPDNKKELYNILFPSLEILIKNLLTN